MLINGSKHPGPCLSKEKGKSLDRMIKQWFNHSVDEWTERLKKYENKELRAKLMIEYKQNLLVEVC